MRRLLFILCCGWVCSPVLCQSPLPDFRRTTMLVFSGSDWCLPCINFEKEVLQDSTFLAFAKKHFDILEADFPQRKKLTADLQKRNDALAARYNPNGYFPRVVLLNAHGQVLRQLTTEGSSSSLLIKEITPFIEDNTEQEYRKKCLLMGSSFEFTIVARSPQEGQRLLDICVAEVERLENLLSEWRDSTQVAEINRQAGQRPVAVSPEVYDFLKRCQHLSNITQGAFDVSFRGMDLWTFDNKEHSTFPDTAAVKAELNHINYQNIRLIPPDSVFLSKKAMAIGFGASGKGFAADRVKQLMQKEGVKAGVINASGDLTAWGTRPDGSPWKVGIADPENPYQVLYWLEVQDQAVATSGSYEKYFEYKGKRYAHILNPKTGYPVTDKKSVTIISPSAELSDALATAIFVMNIEAGLDLIDQLPNTECLIIDSQNKVYTSKELNFVE